MTFLILLGKNLIKNEWYVIESLENIPVAFMILDKENYNMDKNEYTLVNKFNCCGKTMVTVIIVGKAACVMSELEYNNMIKVKVEHKMRNMSEVA